MASVVFDPNDDVFNEIFVSMLLLPNLSFSLVSNLNPSNPPSPAVSCLAEHSGLKGTKHDGA